MSAFGSGYWPNEFGRSAGFDGTANVAMLEATASTTTEGTDKLTLTVRETGLYQINVGLRVSVASDAATSHTIVGQVAYNDGSAISAENVQLDGVTAGTLNGKTLNANFYQTTVIRAVVGTTITVTLAHAVTGGKTAGVGSYIVSLGINRI